jgi:predicted metal-dependent RNase
MMFEPTLSNILARRIVENERDAVLIVGHAVEGTPARRLQDAAAEGPGAPVRLADGQVQPVHCTVERFRFSGHSHRQELLQIVEQMAPETVVLVHGEPDAQAWMQERIQERHPEIDVRRPEWGEVMTL